MLLQFSKVKSELFTYFKALFKNPLRSEKQFILFSHGRSGSELLRNLINSHPEIYCDGEIFLHRKALFPKKYLKNRSRLAEKKIYGYKAKLYQLERQYRSDAKLLKEFFSDDYQILYLRRKNFLRQAISIDISKQRNKWHDTHQNPLDGEKFIIDCNNLIKKIDWIADCEKREREILKGLEYLFISYEDDLLNEANHQQTLDKIFNFLGVNSIPVNTEYVKTTLEHLKDFIENYEEVLDALNKTKYVHFLDE